MKIEGSWYKELKQSEAGGSFWTRGTKVNVGVALFVVSILTLGYVGGSGYLGYSDSDGSTAWTSTDQTFITTSSGNRYNATFAGLTSAAAIGGTITLPACTIRLTGDIDFISNTVLVGQGNNTVIQTGTITSGGWLDITNVHDVTLSNFQIIGSYGIQIKASTKKISDFKIKDIDITYNSTTSPSSTYPFYVISTNYLLENVSFLNCRVLNSTTYGWMFHGSDLGGDHLNNIILENCYARNCGRYNWVNNWVTGFSVEDPTSIENMTFINCKAEGCRESGFHLENEVTKKNIKLIGCTSNNNSKKGLNASFGAGYLMGENTTLIGCSSLGNKNGVRCYNDKTNSVIIISGCSDYGSGNGTRVSGRKGNVLIDGFSSDKNYNYGTYIEGVANLTLSDSVFSNIEGNGTFIASSRNVTANGNRYLNCEWGFFLGGTESNINVWDNTIINCHRAVHAEAGILALSVCRNTITKVDGTYAIYSNAYESQYNDNNLYNIHGYGMYITPGTNNRGSQINNNRISNYGWGENGDAIHIQSGENFTIHDNYIYNGGAGGTSDGIELTSSYNCTLMGNIIAVTDRGIFETTSNFNTILGNNVKTCTTPLTIAGGFTISAYNFGSYSIIPLVNMTAYGVRAGYMWYSVADNKLYIYDGSAWDESTFT